MSSAISEEARHICGSSSALAGFVFILACGFTPALAADDPWADFRFLMGEWVGNGQGQPGRGSGEFTLTPDLQGKVLLRRNRNEYPAAAGRPASTHDDLMVIYRQEPGQPVRASYFDSEGHVIQYSVEPSVDKERLVFLSEAQPSAPRFRLTYAKGKADTLSIKFEIAPPDQPDQFKTYVDGTVRRKGKGKPK
jgi:hypothetical protein